MRRQINKNVNVNLFDCIGRGHIRKNAIAPAPEIVVRPIWIHEEVSAVEIIESNSSTEVETPQKYVNMHHDWSYTNDDDIQQIEDNYQINRKAREKRRTQIENNMDTYPCTYKSTNLNNNTNLSNSFYTNYHCDYSDDKLKFSHQMNCLTILNEYLIDSDTSTEGFDDLDIITSNDVIFDTEPWNSNSYNDQTVTYDADLKPVPRTIWIYSFKNKHSSDDVFTNNDIESSSSSASSTSNSGDVKNKSASSCRIRSPIPLTYVPRLDLSLLPTLSTVTETSENIQLSPRNLIKSANKIIKKPNSWFSSKSDEVDNGKSVNKHTNLTNIIDWMALSPRERRPVDSKCSSDTWVSHLHLAQPCEDIKGENHEYQNNETEKIQKDSVNIEVDVEIHIETSKSDETTTATAVKDECSTKELKYSATIRTNSHKDQSNHHTSLPTNRLIPRHHKSTQITDNLEKSEHGTWSRETGEEKEISVYDYVLDISKSHDDETTPVSYYISLGNTTEIHKSWFKRIINLFKCCK